MKKNGLSKAERIYHRDDIRNLWSKGDSLVERPIRMVYLKLEKDDTAPIQIMTVAPKKRYKTAVQRNRIKRLLREAYRLNKSNLIKTAEEQGIRIAIMFIFNGKDTITFEALQSKIILLLHRLESSLKVQE